MLTFADVMDGCMESIFMIPALTAGDNNVYSSYLRPERAWIGSEWSCVGLFPLIKFLEQMCGLTFSSQIQTVPSLESSCQVASQLGKRDKIILLPSGDGDCILSHCYKYHSTVSFGCCGALSIDYVGCLLFNSYGQTDLLCYYKPCWIRGITAVNKLHTHHATLFLIVQDENKTLFFPLDLLLL